MQQCSPASVVTRKSIVRAAHFDATAPDSLADFLWRQPERLVREGETLQRSGLRSTVLLTWDHQRYVLKHYRPDWWQAAKGLVQTSRAWSTWTTTRALADAGVATPRPVACIENRWGRWRRDSYLTYPYVEGRTLRSYLSNEAKESPALADDLWRQLSELWLLLAQIRASLADANTGNFIVGSDQRVWAIDLDKARFHRSAHAAGRHLQRAWEQLLRSAAKCSSPHSPSDHLRLRPPFPASRPPRSWR